MRYILSLTIWFTLFKISGCDNNTEVSSNNSVVKNATLKLKANPQTDAQESMVSVSQKSNMLPVDTSVKSL